MTATKAKISQHSAKCEKKYFYYRTSVCIISTLLLVSIVINVFVHLFQFLLLVVKLVVVVRCNVAMNCKVPSCCNLILFDVKEFVSSLCIRH